MPHVISDPDDLLRFANDLQGAIHRIVEETRTASAEFSELRDIWRDEKYDEFGRTFEASVALLRRFCGEGEAYVDYLRQKAHAGQEYLGW